MSTPGGIEVIIPAAGRGRRMGAGRPKQYLPLTNTATVLETTVAALRRCPEIGRLILAISPEDPYLATQNFCRDPKITVIIGGPERADSVRLALAAVTSPVVMVHDAVRPLVTPTEISRLVAAFNVCPQDGALLAMPAVDTLKLATGEPAAVAQTLPREKIFQAQTPQIFMTASLRTALEHARAHGLTVSDEASAVEAVGGHPRLVCGSRRNFKLTTPDDLALARALLAVPPAPAR